MKLFSGSSNKPLTEKIATSLGTSLSPIENFTFPDGERRIQIQVPVLDEDCVIVQSTNPPVDENYIELFLIIDGLKRSGAKSVTVVMPYMGYMRQDHIFRDGEAVSLAVMVRILESLKVDRFIGLDFHTVKIPEFFHIPVTHLSALELFAKEIIKNQWNNEHSILVSPDLGGLNRISKMSELLDGMSWVATVKDRDVNTGSIEIDTIQFEQSSSVISNEVRDPLPEHKDHGISHPFHGVRNDNDLKGKRALIVDDMISSGGTIIKSAELLKKHGVSEVHVFVTHPIFSNEAPQLLQESIVDTVYVTDGVFVPEEKRFGKLEVLSISDMIAQSLITQ